MANTYYVTNPFYTQWHDEGHQGGQWNGSSTGTDFFSLDKWTLPATSAEYTFYFTAKQDASHGASEIFATMADVGNGQKFVYGAKMEPNAALTATVLRFEPRGTELVFTAGRLISDDPKIRISQSSGHPTSFLIWDGQQWLYSYDPDAPPTAYQVYDCTDPDAAITLGPWGEHTIYVTDQTTDGSHVCAVFYADADEAPGTNVGIVQSETALTDPRRSTPITITGPSDRDWQCTLELFIELTNYRSSVLREG